MSSTSIEWATHVWNPFTGCDRVSPGCAHCYAIDVAAGNQRRELGRARKAAVEGKPAPILRYQNDGDAKTSGAGFGFTVHWDKLERPERFPAGARVFVNSMSDVFHEQAPGAAISQLLSACADQEDVDYLILTKRPERVLDFFQDESAHEGWYGFPDNVWLGVTIENRRFVQRADILRDIPARTRFISAEPLLGPLLNELGYPERPGRAWRWDDGYVGPSLDLTGIDWLIAGGESGPNHRPIDADWVRELRDECLATQTEACRICHGDGTLRAGPQCWLCKGTGFGPGTAFFFKQWGGRTPKAGGRDLDGRTWDEFPRAREAVAA